MTDFIERVFKVVDPVIEEVISEEEQDIWKRLEEGHSLECVSYLDFMNGRCGCFEFPDTADYKERWNEPL